MISREGDRIGPFRVAVRKWLMSKIVPKRFGDKIDLTHADPDGMTVKFITVYEAKKDKP